MTIYISIPYTGHESEIHERCSIAHKLYDSLGRVVTPVDVVKDSSTPYNCCIGKCIEAVLDSDMIVFANGWSESRGCNLEFQAGMIYNKQIKTDCKI